MEKEELIKRLNDLLELEYGSYVRYKTQASLFKGIYAELLGPRFNEIADDELGHTSMMRERIVALGGVPSTRVKGAEIEPEAPPQEVLKYNVGDEQKVIGMYRDLMSKITHDDMLLHETLEHLYEDECEHLEELQRFIG